MNGNSQRQPWIVALAVALCAVLLAYGAARLVHGLMDSALGEVTQLPVSNAQYIEAVGDSVVVYDGSTINRFSSSGKSLWDEGVLVGGNYSVDANDHGVVIWKNSSYSVLQLSDHQNLYSSNLDDDKSILSARLGSKYLAVLYTEDGNSTVRIVDMDGRIQDEIAFESQVVVDYGFYSGGSLFWAMAMDTSGTVPTCTVSTYRFNRKSTLGSISDGEQVIYHAQFESNSICLVGEEYIKHYDETGVEKTNQRMLVYGWCLMDSGDRANSPMMVFVPETQAANAPRISDVRLICGTRDNILRLPFAAHSLFAKGETLYAFSDQAAMIGSLTGDIVEAYRMPVPVDDVVGVTDDRVAVIYSNNMYYLVVLA